jgi:hypothetical protein
MKTCILLLLLFIPLETFADFVSGNALYNWSKEKESNYIKGLFGGYVIGIVDTTDGILFCIPKGSSVGQLNAVVKKYLEQNPEEWNKSASNIVILSLEKAFPCKK